MNLVEDKLSDLDARGSEEFDNLSNERNLDRFILNLKIRGCHFSKVGLNPK